MFSKLRLNYRFNITEFTGALGDLGTLLPLSLALIMLNGLNPIRLFLLVGIFYILSGVFYRFPISIQPLKVAAVIAISMNLPPSTISAAGILMGILMLTFALTGGIDIIGRFFSTSIIRGIQLGVGLLLTAEGVRLALSPGIFLGDTLSSTNFSKFINLGYHLPSFMDFINAFIFLVLPQIPVTLGNAAFAASDLARRYHKDRAAMATPKNLAVSMGVFNLTAGIFGAMPVCHGSGGIAAHYRFGARTGGAPIIMGVILLSVVFIFGHMVTSIISFVPLALLGFLLITAGVQMLCLVLDLKKWRDAAVALLVAAVTGFTRNLALAITLGIFLRFILKLR